VPQRCRAYQSSADLFSGARPSALFSGAGRLREIFSRRMARMSILNRRLFIAVQERGRRKLRPHPLPQSQSSTLANFTASLFNGQPPYRRRT
jgi:hypothetical protein